MRLPIRTKLAALKGYRVNLSSSFFTYMVASATNLAASYSMMLVMINALSKKQYGQYGIYISLFSMLLIFMNFGHKELIFKQSSVNQLKASSEPLKPAFRSFYRWNLLLLALIQLLLIINTTVYAAGMMFLGTSWMLTFAAYHRGSADYSKDAWALPLQRLLWLLLSLTGYYIIGHLNLVMLFFFGILATVVCITWLYLPISKIGLIKFNTTALLSNDSNRRQSKLLLSYLVIEISSVLYLKSDVLLLRFFEIDLVVIANYFFAIQIFDIAVLVLMPIGYFFLNRLNQLEVKQRAEVRLAPVVFLVLTLTAIMHGTFALLAPLIFPTAAPKYIESISIVFWVMCSLYPVAINILLSSRLIAANKERTYAKICFVALTFNVIANSMLIPTLGLTGVIAIKLFTEVLILGLLIHACKAQKHVLI